MWPLSVCVLLSCALGSLSNMAAHKPWYVFVTSPIVACSSEISHTLHTSQDTLYTVMRHLLRCTEFYHRQKMKCSTKDKKPKFIEFEGRLWEYRVWYRSAEWPDELLTTPCAHIAIQARASYLHCIWRVHVTSSLTINASFTDFSVPIVTTSCSHDRLQVEDMEHQKYIQRFCGKRLPFNIVPNFSRLKIELHIAWRNVGSSELTGFSMLYQVINKHDHMAQGAEPNMETNTSLVYGFSWATHIESGYTHNIYSLYFRVYIDFYILVNISGTLSVESFLTAYEGPSAACHLLSIFHSAVNETLTSFGTSLLLQLYSAPMVTDNVTITFARSPRIGKTTPSVQTTVMKNSLHMPLRESQYCNEQHAIVYCELLIELNVPDMFIKLEDIVISMEIPYIHDCRFGSVWVFDALSEKHVWKWCGYKAAKLPALTSTGNNVAIKVIMYQVHDSASYISLQFAASRCPGLFIAHPDLVHALPQIASATVSTAQGMSHAQLKKLPGRCLGVQFFPENAKPFIGFFIRGSREFEVNQFSIIHLDYKGIGACAELWDVTVTGRFAANKYGDGRFSQSPRGREVFLNAVNIRTDIWDYNNCGKDDDIVINIHEGCSNLFTDESLLSRVIYEVPEFVRHVRLYSGCEKFTIRAVEKSQTVKLAFDDRLLCLALRPAHGSFPCVTKHGILCTTITSCVLRIQAQLASESCKAKGYYVDVLNSKSTVKLRWFVNSQSKMIYHTGLHEDGTRVSNLLVDITNYDLVSSCSLELTQIVVKDEQPPPIAITVQDRNISKSCLAGRSYYDYISSERVLHCFKTGISPERLVVDGDTYIRVNSSDLSWLKAEEFCQNRSGHLVSITSMREENLVKSLFDGGPTLFPAAVYVGLQFKDPNQLHWVDERPVSYMSWNNAFMRGNTPMDMFQIEVYATDWGLDVEELQYRHVSESLVQTVSSVLQPTFLRGVGECGYLMLTSRHSATDWLMGPCKQITNPGAFLCRVKHNRTHLVLPDTDMTLSEDTVEARAICSAGWTALQEGCLKLYVGAKNCMNDGVKLTSMRRSLHNWLSYYYAHDQFQCADVQFQHKSGEMEKVFNSSNSSTCTACFTVKQPVTGCPHGLFECTDRSCVSPAAVCDGKYDCVHGEDESTCDRVMCHIHEVYQEQSFCSVHCSLEQHMCLCGVGFWQCRHGGCIALSKYCDHQQDCEDASDEDRCDNPACSSGQAACKNGQCVDKQHIYNLHRNCIDNSDETDHKYSYSHINPVQCGEGRIISEIRLNDLIPDCPEFTDEELYVDIVSTRELSGPSLCAAGHLACVKHHTQCFPADKLCMYELDMEHQMIHCRNGFHVSNCEGFPCSGSFKCPSSYCVPLHYLCDWNWHCPHGEDEQHCTVNATILCHAEDIVHMISPSLPLHVYKDFLNGSCISAIIPHDFPALGGNHLSCPGLFHCQFGQCVHPSLLCDGIVHCPLFADDETSCTTDTCPDGCACVGKTVHCSHTQHSRLPPLPLDVRSLVLRSAMLRTVDGLARYSHLLQLDLSFNELEVIHDNGIRTLVKLLHLDASHNKLTTSPSFTTTTELVFLNLSYNALRVLASGMFRYNPELKVIDLSSNNLHHLQAGSFGSLHTLSSLSLSNNSIVSFDPSLLHFFHKVEVLVSDKYQYCCLAEVVTTCSSSNDGFSSCESLLAKPVLKFTVYIVGVAGITLNSYVIFTRIKYKKTHSELIINLALSDATYSVYLLLIGMADAYYAGAYILYDDWWRRSLLCRAMSVLSVFASELSMAMLVCISIERYVIICNVSRFKLRSGMKLHWVMLPVVWCSMLVLSLLPLVLSWLLNEPYIATNSICSLLDLSGLSAYRALYLLCVHFGLNGAGFLVILIMYAHIVRINIQSSRSVGRRVKGTFFKRTVAIVVTDFLCWAPVTGFVMASYFGMATSPDVAVWMAVVVLPVNSAANPIIYTLTTACKATRK